MHKVLEAIFNSRQNLIITATAAIFTLVGVFGVINVLRVEGNYPDQVWLSSPPVADYMQLIHKNSSWQRSISTLSVLKLSTHFASTTGDNTLKEIIEFAKSQGIRLAIEGEMQTPGRDGCGEGVEGYNVAGAMKALAIRISRIGGRIDYIAMDEPLWFGHFARKFWRPSKGLCHASIREVSENVKRVYRDIISIFPDVEIGDIEYIPLSSEIDSEKYLSELKEWVDTFDNLHYPLSFIHLDVEWPRNDADNSKFIRLINSIAEFARAKRMRIGVIFAGSQDAQTGEEWVTDASERMEFLMNALKLSLNDYIIQTWMKFPTHALPESDPSALTHLIIKYIDLKTAIIEKAHPQVDTVRAGSGK